ASQQLQTRADCSLPGKWRTPAPHLAASSAAMIGRNTMQHRTPKLALAAVAASAALMLAACTPASDTPAPATSGSASGDAPGVGGNAIGFITVGPKDDYGCNQAVIEASEVIGEAFPDYEILTAENVPEDDTAVATMEQMID